MTRGRRKKTETVEETPAVPQKKTPQAGRLENTLNQPMTISYDGLSIRLSPRQHDARIADMERLGALPRGVVVHKCN